MDEAEVMSAESAPAAAVSPSRPRPRMPLVLTLAAPGLGHLRHGEAGAGAGFLGITLLLSIEIVAATLWVFLALFSGRAVLVPFLAWLGLFAAGLAYTGLAAVDSLRLSDEPPRPPGIVRLAGLAGGGCVALLAAAILVRAAVEVLPLLQAGVIG